ncbi:hypothetical protein ACFWFZ_00255 [Streptomyces sp. NPDC060232]|uniref:hypothetical protein n=1 Tax=Streptomyces sp. NPDC060232 TaxID=3347079 RepID=UPI0036485F5E
MSGKAAIAALTALWGLLAAATGSHAAIVIAGVLCMATPVLLPRSVPTDRTVLSGGPRDDR